MVQHVTNNTLNLFNTFEMSRALFYIFVPIILSGYASAAHQTDINFRVEAGTRTCFIERGRPGQLMEAQYHVLDGQHGDLDISFDITDPTGRKLVNDHKKPHNALMFDLDHEGDYEFCLDNTYSRFNSKLVYVYVFIEEKAGEDAEVTVTEGEQNEEVQKWMGTNEAGEPYYLLISDVAASVTRTLKHVVKARHMMDLYAASKTRDTYLAFEDTFIVDAWSGTQITCMLLVGLIQVYMIKKLFKRPVLPTYR